MTVTEQDALIVIDVQKDFCAGGSLAVPGGDDVVPLINDMMGRFRCVVLTQDWHPAHHSSFASSHPGRSPFDVVEMPYGPQVLWPDHCVQGHSGSNFHQGLDIIQAQLVVRKGFRREVDSYSAFFENDHVTPTGLNGYLRERGFKRVYLVGLALDYCVRYSAEDARRLGFDTVVVERACRAIDVNGTLADTLTSFRNLGVTLA